MPMRRTIKNVVKHYTEAQIKVREATSNDPWGPSSTLMSEIADLTYNVVAFTEIMQMVWKRLNDHGKNWRHVYKSLTVLDYIIKTGSEKVAQQCKENIYTIQTLKDFQYTEDNKDQGINVREKAKQLVALLKDDERLRNERSKAIKAKERFAQNSQGVGSQPSRSTSAESPTFKSGSSSDSPTRRRRDSSNEIDTVRPASVGEEELQLQLALAMSREEHEEELRKQKSDDIKLQMALDESRRQAATESPVGQKTLQSLAGQAQQRQGSDAWGGPGNKPSGDPWGATLPAPPGSHKPHPAPPTQPTADPWASPVHQPAPPAPADPWSPPTSTQGPAPSDPWSTPTSSAQQPSPWGTPASGGAGAAGGSPFASSGFHSPTSNGTNDANNVDEGFEMLSSRSSPSKPSTTTGQHLEMFDPLAAEVKIDPWNMDGMGSSLPGDEPKRTKTPQEFLGTHSGLVNLDELVKPSQPSKKANNPFASPQSTNPFEQVAPARVPLNQLQAASQNSGFTQVSSTGLLPAPMVPMAQAAPVQIQTQQGYNPFL